RGLKMTEKVEKRKAFLINFAFAALILGIIYVFFKYMFWITAPFVLSFFFAVLLQRPIRWLDKKSKNKCHALWAFVLVFLSIAIILIPIITIIAQIVQETGSFINYLTQQLSDFPSFMQQLQESLLKLLSFLPDGIYSTVSEHITKAITSIVQDFDLTAIGINTDTIKSTISTGVNGVYSVVKNVPNALIGIVIGIVALILFTKDYNRIVHFIQLQLPEGKKNLLFEIKQVFSSTILKMIRAYGIILLITFCELSIGFTILTALKIMSNEYMYLIAAAIAIFDILPVAGSGGILIPWALISFVTGNVSRGIGLLVMYAIITVIRQYIEPKIVGDTLGVNPIVTLAGLYFGLKLFGFTGMFIVPISIMTLKAFNDTGRIRLWKTSHPIDEAMLKKPKEKKKKIKKDKK
ncbi:MAG: sporulation integral membrane protein YtvI, partial [Clostridiales bacterium]|nr:sporulation integral membrane protein YtvI [Clostridiales bacterium]